MHFFLIIVSCLAFQFTYTHAPSTQENAFCCAHYQDDEGIINKITEYVARVQDELFAQGKIQRPLTRELSQILDNRRKKMSYDELHELFSYVSTMYKLCGSDKNMEQTELACALLIRVAGPLTLFVRSLVLHSLLRLDREIAYWEFQDYHPIYYFFHKAPSKIFSGTDQKKQVRNNIIYLRVLQKEHFTILGNLTTHVTEFNPHDSTDKQYVWLSELLQSIGKLSGGSILPELPISVDTLLVRMRSAIKIVGDHQTAITRAIARTHPDGHMSKNWLRYSGMLIAAGSLSSYLYTNRHELPEWGKNIQKNIKKLTIVPIEDFHNAFVKSESKKELQTLYKNTILDYKNKLKTLTIKNKKIKQAAQKLDIAFLEQKIFTQYAQDFNKDPDKDINFEAGRVAKGLGWAFSFDANKLDLNPILQALKPTPHLVPLAVLYGRVYKDNLLRRNRIMLALTAFLPMAILTGSAGVGMHRLYGWTKRKPNFDTIKMAIKEIVDLLNVYGDTQPRDMHAEDYGKLMYFVYKLKKEKSQVPEKYLRPFTNDITKLESVILTAEQKMNVIAFMYRSYPFLAPIGSA